jgi:hypothetical protein
VPDEDTELMGKGRELFAGIPVSNFRVSLEWYQRFFGRSPRFFPNDVEAVWSIGDHQWLYIIVDPERAGGAVQTVICDALENVIAGIAARGLHFSREERPGGGVRKVMYDDPDGNEIGLGYVPPQQS